MVRHLSGAVCALVLTAASAWSAPQDAIDLSQAAVYNSPADVASWPITAGITTLQMRPRGVRPDGLAFTSPAIDKWPNYTPPGWDGPIQYTVWAVVRINGQWYTSGFIQMWHTRESTGAPILTDFAINWAYDSRWGPMRGHQPQVGEQMGFFLTAGNARGVGGVTSVRERTNVVLVSLPANDTGFFEFKNSDETATVGDYDGNGRTDAVLYNPSTAVWHTSDNSFTHQFGAAGDVPAPADYDGDGKTDIAVYRPSTGVWYVLLSGTNWSTVRAVQFGMSTDTPVPRDYDGDGKADIAIFRSGLWYILKSGDASVTAVQWGAAGDVPLPRDYDGDGKADVAVYRPATGVWYAHRSSNPSSHIALQWGGGGDIPVPGDYDGDGKADIAVYRPGSGVWYVLSSSTSALLSYQWGSSADLPVPGRYAGNGAMDLAVYRPATNEWFVRY